MDLYKVNKDEFNWYKERFGNKWIDYRHADFLEVDHKMHGEDMVTDQKVNEDKFNKVHIGLGKIRGE